MAARQPDAGKEEAILSAALDLFVERDFLELHHHRSYLDDERRATESQVFDFGIAMVKKAQAEQALRPLDAVLLMAFANGAFLGVFRQIIAKRLPLTKASFMAAEQC